MHWDRRRESRPTPKGTGSKEGCNIPHRNAECKTQLIALLAGMAVASLIPGLSQSVRTGLRRETASGGALVPTAACLKTKSQTWRNCPMAGVVGALFLFHLKNYPFAGKKAFTIKDTIRMTKPARLATSGEEQKAENEPAIEVRPCTKPTDPKLTVSDVVHPPAVHRQHLCRDPARLRGDQE